MNRDQSRSSELPPARGDFPHRAGDRAWLRRVAALLAGAWWLLVGAPLAEAQLTLSSVTPSAVTNTPGAAATYTINYTWPNLTASATGAVITVTVPSPAQNTSSSSVTLVNNSQITNSVFATSNQTIYFEFASPLPAGSAGSLQFQASLGTGGTVTNGSRAVFGIVFSAVGQATASNYATLTASGVTDNASISKSVMGAGTISTNVPIYYELSPRNGNPSLNITNWTMVDLLPPSAVYLSSSPTGFYNATLGTVTWTTNSFLVGSAPNYTLEVYVPSTVHERGHRHQPGDHHQRLPGWQHRGEKRHELDEDHRSRRQF